MSTPKKRGVQAHKARQAKRRKLKELHESQGFAALKAEVERLMPSLKGEAKKRYLLRIIYIGGRANSSRRRRRR